MAERRSWSWLEVPLLFLLLVGGAFLRYWLSTAIPFDESELRALSTASVRQHSVRIPFIMFNGLSLFMLYILMRRSAGVPAAFALLFLLQTGVGFQELALRIRWPSFVILIVLLGAAYWRFSWPPWRPPMRVARALVAVCVLLAAQGTWLIFTLPARLDGVRIAAAADPDAFHASLRACGGGMVTALESLEGCELAWPDGRSLAQQEAWLAHAQDLRANATPIVDGSPLPRFEEPHFVVFDRPGVALFLVGGGEPLEITQRVLGVSR
jgi:hypothetical protein